MLSARTALLAGMAAVGVMLTGCQDEPRSRIAEGCEAPTGTAPLVFESANRQLFGFIEAPRSRGPHPAVLLIHDAGRTDITRGNGDFAALRGAFRDAGFATVVWDAAGSGCSGGRYRGLADLYVRADDVLAAVDALSAYDAIDTGRIGAFALGEGAWVAPMAAARDDAIDFLILVGGAGGDPIERISHAALENLEREGYEQDEAKALADRLADALAMMRDQAPYRDYQAAVDTLSDHPLLPQLSETAGDVYASERRYDELRESAVLHVAPAVFLAALEIPVLAIWGEHDEQVDRPRAESVYREASALAGNDDLTVMVVDDANHAICETSGSPEPAAECRLADGYLEAMTAWLQSRALGNGSGERQTKATSPAGL